ncbi:beta-1,4-galactosyltransferase 4-like [Contarinia nasturtii]|uniref:beta-1,4-galactosyltransferase 4-like n=1 Tax=Contarinia nasturtii TaxID=265458 RepID=UPI0012D3F62E|nr:beta-1,4-galactosyltransferase 4-like [Contarinia nasturtii]
MAFIRRLHRIEIIILCAILMMLILNFVYFQRLEVKLDAVNYLSKIPMGTSDRTNEFEWPSIPNSLVEKCVKKKAVFGPKQKPSGNSSFTPNNSHIHQMNVSLDRNLHKKAIYDFDDYEYKNVIERPPLQNNITFVPLMTPSPIPSTTPEPVVRTPPLKKPKTQEAEKSQVSKETMVSEPDMCPQVPPNLNSDIQPDTSDEPIHDIERKLSEIVYSGGFYSPSKCKARQSVAIIVPYRNRPEELAIFLKNIHPFLQKQQLEYGIFIVEQTVGTIFNRAMLLNIGFLEAKKIRKFDCYIFHDVDLLPLDERILYRCSDNPKHLAVAVDMFGNELESQNSLSGVLAVTAKQFEKMNGFSNLFWGWGCEDLDLANRLKKAGYKIERCDSAIARYKMIGNATVEPNTKRFELLSDGPNKFNTIGLNSIKYTVQCIEESPAYMWIFTTPKPEVPGTGSNVEQLGIK